MICEEKQKCKKCLIVFRIKINTFKIKYFKIKYFNTKMLEILKKK